MKKKISESAEEKAYRLIIRLILNHQYKPGDLILESDLSERFGLSATPINKGLNRLVAEGFLEKRRKRGYFIPLPTPQDAREIFFARIGIEGQIAYSVTTDATDSEIEDIREILTKETEAVKFKKKELYASLNEQFHLGLADICRNSYLQRFARYLFWRSNLYIFFFDSFYRENDLGIDIQLTPAQHLKVLEAIAERNPEAAERFMRDHIRRTYDMIITPTL
ncbi:MAG: GntR family transcriptional regulator [Deltaproteobacteria bacterium]|nr:GntR family transcriptional regulator [Deltaproteobacteria bacterium]